MTGLPYQEGQAYLLNSIVKDGLAEYASGGYVIIETELRNGIAYRATFKPAGESMNGKVVRCVLCQPLT